MEISCYLLLTPSVGDGKTSQSSGPSSATIEKLAFLQLSCQHSEMEASRDMVLKCQLHNIHASGHGTARKNSEQSHISPVGVL